MLEACFPRHAALCCTLAELKRRRVISLPAWSSDFSVNAACLKVTWRERRRAESLASNAIEEPAASVRPSAQRALRKCLRACDFQFTCSSGAAHHRSRQRPQASASVDAGGGGGTRAGCPCAEATGSEKEQPKPEAACGRWLGCLNVSEPGRGSGALSPKRWLGRPRGGAALQPVCSARSRCGGCASRTPAAASAVGSRAQAQAQRDNRPSGHAP